MKKYLLVLGMVLSLMGVSACKSTEIAESTVSQADAEQIADAYIGLVNEIVVQNINIEENAEAIKQYYGVDAAILVAAADSYRTALEDLGTYEEVKSVSYTEDEEGLTVSATITGSNTTPKGAPREAEVLIILSSPKLILTSMLTNVNYTFGELMTTAALNTVLGMGTVFAVLTILMFCISSFKLINNAEKTWAEKKAGNSSATATPVDNAVAQIEANEDSQDDTELVAVISAAIAAYEGASGADGYVVRSIRRRY